MYEEDPFIKMLILQQLKWWLLYEEFTTVVCIVQTNSKFIFQQNSQWSMVGQPRLYCEYAVTNEPAKVIGIEPSTIPDNNASTI